MELFDLRQYLVASEQLEQANAKSIYDYQTKHQTIVDFVATVLGKIKTRDYDFDSDVPAYTNDELESNNYHMRFIFRNTDSCAKYIWDNLWFGDIEEVLQECVNCKISVSFSEAEFDELSGIGGSVFVLDLYVPKPL